MSTQPRAIDPSTGKPYTEISAGERDANHIGVREEDHAQYVVEAGAVSKGFGNIEITSSVDWTPLPSFQAKEVTVMNTSGVDIALSVDQSSKATLLDGLSMTIPLEKNSNEVYIQRNIGSGSVFVGYFYAR